jgi:hypothetical protein
MLLSQDLVDWRKEMPEREQQWHRPVKESNSAVSLS